MEKAVMITMCVWFVLGAIATHSLVGKPRKPTTHGQAIFGYVAALLLMLGTIYLHKGVIF